MPTFVFVGNATKDAEEAEGWTKRGLSLAREYRALRVRVEVARRAFRLAPMGKPMEEAPKAPEDPFAQFDGGGTRTEREGGGS